MLEALIGFNAGVEAGQILILVLIVPVLFSLKNSFKLSHFALRASTGAIGGIGIYWFLVRAFGMSVFT